MSSVTSWYSLCGLQGAYAFNFTCFGQGCDFLSSFPNVTCNTNESGLTCTNGIQCTDTPEFWDVTSWSLNGTRLIHVENITVSEEHYPAADQTIPASSNTTTRNPDCIPKTRRERASTTAWFYHDDPHNHGSTDIPHALEKRERRLGTQSSLREDVISLVNFVRDTTKASNNKAVQSFDVDDVAVKIFDFACEKLANIAGNKGIVAFTTFALELESFRTGCATLVTGVIEGLLAETGPADIAALPLIGWAANSLCSAVIAQTFLTAIPGSRQTYNSLKKQLCGKVKCMFITDTLSDHANCGRCNHHCGSSDVCINGACSNQYCGGSHTDFSRCGYGDNYDTCTCASTFSGTGLCAEYTTSCVGSLTDDCESSDDCKTGFICGLMPGCDTQTCLNVAPCGTADRPSDQTETLPQEQQKDWWTFRLLNDETRQYVQNPGSVYSIDHSNLISSDTGIEVNTNCIKVIDTVSNFIGSYLNKNDDFYFGWDPKGEAFPETDTCCLQVFGNDNCAIEANAEDYETYCQSGGGKWKFAFNVASWQVTNCVSMFEP